MMGLIRDCLHAVRPRTYYRQECLILLNGLAEQPESWFHNRPYWQQYFDVKTPDLVIYDSPMMQRRLQEGLPITVDYLTKRLETYLDTFVQRPPYHLVASSLGGQVAIEYTVRHPERVGGIVLLCPSGVGGKEKLPVVEGVRHGDYNSLLASVFHSRVDVDPGMVRLYEKLFTQRPWRKGLLRTVRGTSSNSIREKLRLVRQPTLVICGAQDKIVETSEVKEALFGLPNYRLKLIRRCGHAPQIERPALVNRLVHKFLTTQGAAPARYSLEAHRCETPPATVHEPEQPLVGVAS